MTISVSISIARPPTEVWAYLESIGRHVEWMGDAEAIRFVTEQQTGIGTIFECDTKVGPFRLVDVMEITAWAPPREMGVRHRGLVEGEGHFTVEPNQDGFTQFGWTETLKFPWWMGGPVGGLVANPILRAIWRSNLKRLKLIVEQRP